jgi:hypothetical protein
MILIEFLVIFLEFTVPYLKLITKGQWMKFFGLNLSLTDKIQYLFCQME